MKTLFISFSFLIIFFLCESTFAQTPHTPQAGTKERKEILDAGRIPAVTELNQNIVFVIDHFLVYRGWAFFYGTMQQPGGKPVDFSRTKYYDAWKDGFFTDYMCVLLHKENGSWQVIDFAIGPTDVPYVTWWRDHNAPKAIFDYFEE